MSTGLPWLTILGLIPLVGALLVAFVPGSAETAKRMALGFSLVTLVVGIIAAMQFDRGSSAQFQLVEQHEWIPQFGVSYALGVDGIALVLILMALVLTPICLLAAWRDVPEEAEPRGAQRVKTYFALLLVLETFMVGVFAATDVFLFYVFFEAMLIPVYFLIGRFGGPRRQYAAMKFLLFSLAGGLVMLVAVIALYLQGPGGSDGFLIERLTGLTIDPTTERLLFVGFFLAFAVKAPMVPFHTWLPDAATESTPATATLLVGVLDKVGTFGMIRFCLQLFPEASQWATPVVVVLAVISVIYGALLAIGQTDMMRLISYTSISHFGFIVLGIFAFTGVGQAGSTLYMVNHGFSTAALFLFAAMLVRRHRTNSKRIGDYGGWQRVTPGLAGIFLVAGLSGLALPGLSSFVSEFLVLVGSFSTQPVATVIATMGIILAALYILLMYKRVMTGPKPEELAAEGVTVDDRWRKSSGGTTVRDLTTRDKIVAAPLIAAFVVLGVLPNLALNVINPAVDKTLSYVQQSNPQLNPAGTVAEGSSK
ncbi:NADH-quinone oxidoreductase subunit M [Humibacillus xanthopallidus]|uniref:NADH-quinone oxidoreductase subunit M n=1 Tax=Humibacillus xanthopallidus TaxID=412689 RepID=UPI00384A80A7